MNASAPPFYTHRAKQREPERKPQKPGEDELSLSFSTKLGPPIPLSLSQGNRLSPYLPQLG
jgi:hypothetical protein